MRPEPGKDLARYLVCVSYVIMRTGCICSEPQGKQRPGYLQGWRPTLRLLGADAHIVSEAASLLATGRDFAQKTLRVTAVVDLLPVLLPFQ